MRLTLCVLALAAVSALAAGCGGPTRLQTRGKLLKDGKPLAVAEGEIVRVTLVPVVARGERATDFYTAEFNPADSTFQVKGKDLKGMPPGKYRVAVEHLRNRKDVFKGEFDAEKSPFVFEVNDSSQELTVDLGKKQ